MTGRDASRGACAQPCRYHYALMEEKRPGEYFPIEEDEKGSYIPVSYTHLDVYKRQAPLQRGLPAAAPPPSGWGRAVGGQHLSGGLHPLPLYLCVIKKQ